MVRCRNRSTSTSGTPSGGSLRCSPRPSRGPAVVSSGLTGLPELVARAAIRDVVVRYSHALDRRDWATVRACFHPDAMVWSGTWSGRAHAEYRDRAAGASTTSPEVWAEMTMHCVFESQIDLFAEGARATTYALALHRTRAEDSELPFAIDYGPGRSLSTGARDVTVGVVYEDLFTYEAAAWRIKERRLLLPWSRIDEVGATWSRRDHEG